MVDGTPSRSLSFASLPPELLVQIAKELDRSTALSFARVQAACTSPADYAIWRDVDLRLQEHWGTAVVVQPCTPQEDMAHYYNWVDAVRAHEEDAKSYGDMMRIAAILKALLSDIKRANMVETLRMVPREQALQGLLVLLKAVSPNLRFLIYDMPDDEKVLATNFGEIINHLTFPSLEKIRLPINCMTWFGSVYRLCNVSPKLTTLDLCQSSWDDPDRGSEDPLLDRLVGDTSLERLKVIFEQEETDEDYIERALLVLELIHKSPNLRQLSVGQMDIGREPIIGKILKVFTDLNKLEDLHWSIFGYHFKTLINNSPNAFHSVRRLIMKCRNEIQCFDCIPSLPNLETIILDNCLDMAGAVPIPDGLISQPSVLSIQASLVDLILSTPKLHNLYILPGTIEHDVDMFDQLEEIQEQWIHKYEFTSIINGENELLMIRHFVRYHHFEDHREIPLVEAVLLSTYDPIESHEVDDLIHGRAWVHRIFTIEPTHRTQLHTDYLGLTVPNHVLENMRLVEGVEDFVGRGIEVKDETWFVLVNWEEAEEESRQALEDSEI